MMGAGKSATAEILAARLGLPRYDSDEVVVAEAGMSITEIFHTRGEAAFRRLEAGAVAEIAASPDGVVATGGGVVLDPDNVALMRGSGRVVLLDTPLEDLLRRVGDGARPLVDGTDGQRIAVIREQRRGAYEAAAHVTVDTTGLSSREVADEVERLCVS